MKTKICSQYPKKQKTFAVLGIEGVFVSKYPWLSENDGYQREKMAHNTQARQERERIASYSGKGEKKKGLFRIKEEQTLTLHIYFTAGL